MTSTEPFEVRLSPAAARAFRKFPPNARKRIRSALDKLAASPGGQGRGGTSVKTVRGVDDSFHRLRAGDYRLLYDVIAEDRVLLVLGIVDRGDLERRLRNR